MTTKDLEAIMDRLTSIREHKKQIALTKHRQKSKPFNGKQRLIGMVCMIFCKEVKSLLPKEEDGD